MTQTCKVCSHQDRHAIEQDIVSGQPLRVIGRRWAISKDSVRRHRDAHLPNAVIAAHEVAEGERGSQLLQRTRDHQARAMRIYQDAEATGDSRVAIGALREVRSGYELEGRLTGELAGNTQHSVNINVGAVLSELERMTMRDITPRREAIEFRDDGPGSNDDDGNDENDD